MPKTTPWNKIKKEYLEGATPKELALKYRLSAKTISDKAYEEKWTTEKTKISENIREFVETDLKRDINSGTKKAIKFLSLKIDDDEAKDSDRIAAAKAILDISGLKTSKQEITGKDGESLIQKIFVSEKVQKLTDDHIDDVLNE